MKNIYALTFYFIITVLNINSQTLSLQGILDLHGSGDTSPYSGTDGKAIHLKVIGGDISDLGIYALGVANNGGGSDGPEYTLSGSASDGDDILVYRVGSGTNSESFFSDYFGVCYSEFEVTISTGENFPDGNGDDPVELFENGAVIDNYGDVNGSAISGDPYDDAWVYRNPDGSWIEGGMDCDIESPEEYSVLTSGCPYPICSQTSNVNVTFQVDMSQVLDPFNIPEINGTFNNWCGDCDQMNDLNGDNIWEIQISLIPGDTVEFKYSADGYLLTEPLNSNESCTNGNVDSTNRFFIVPLTNIVVSSCWGSCEPCDIPSAENDLMLMGVTSFDLPASGGKALHLKANEAIEDLSNYGIGTANNGGGTDGQEYAFPSIDLNAGDHILLCRDSIAMATYLEEDCYSLYKFVFHSDSEPSGNGNDAYELFYNGNLIETFGDPDVNGIGEQWEYTNAWAFKDVQGEWFFGDTNCTESAETSSSSLCPYPFCDLSLSENKREINVFNPISIYPIPSSDFLNVKSDQTISFIKIYNLFGKLVFTKTVSSKIFTVDISDLINDFYMIELKTINNSISYSKLIKY